jgi:CrcB protein
MTRFLLVCLGGALGSGARYLTTIGAAGLFGIAFPYGTLIVNILGSFLLGFLMQTVPPTDLRLFLGTGVMGGFTTYSTFNYETTAYLRAGAWGPALLNVGGTVLGCLVAGIAGILAARAVFGR